MGSSLHTLLFQVFAQAASIATSVAVARTLGPEGKGLFTYTLIAMELAATVFAGMRPGILFEYGRNKQAGGAVYAAALRILLFTVIPLSVALSVVAAVVPSQRVLLAVACALPFYLYAFVTSSFFLAASNVQIVNYQNLMSFLGVAAVSIPLLVFFHVGINIVLLVWVAMNAAAALYCAFKVRPYIRYHGSKPLGPLIREQAAFSMKAGSTTFVGYLNLRIDEFIVGLLLGAASLGVYSPAISTGELMWKVTNPVAFAAQGRIASESLDEAMALVAKLTRNILAVGLISGAMLFFAGPWLIEFVYGPPFAKAGEALRFLLPALVAYAVYPVLRDFITFQLGKPLLITIIQIGSILACAAITVATLPSIGILGAAIATSVTYLAVIFTMAMIFLLSTKVPLRRLVLLTPDDVKNYARLFAAGWRRAAQFVAR